jgi:hypothetical protein
VLLSGLFDQFEKLRPKKGASKLVEAVTLVFQTPPKVFERGASAARGELKGAF